MPTALELMYEGNFVCRAKGDLDVFSKNGEYYTVYDGSVVEPLDDDDLKTIMLA